MSHQEHYIEKTIPIGDPLVCVSFGDEQ